MVNNITARHHYILFAPMLIFMVTILNTTVLSYQASAVFDPEVIEKAQNDFPDESTDDRVTIDKTPVNEILNNSQTAKEKNHAKLTPWLLGGGLILLIIAISSFTWFRKRRK